MISFPVPLMEPKPNLPKNVSSQVFANDFFSKKNQDSQFT
jgi:hypothetical protein